MIARVIDWCTGNRFLVFTGTVVLTLWGIWAMTATPLDAVPDISDVLVIVSTEWMGRSPDIIEDQITYPLVTALLSAPKVRTVRGFGRVHVYAQKTRIVFQTRGRFVAVTPRRSHLGGHIWLKRPRAHPRVHRIDSLLARDFVHNFRLTRLEDLDEAFCDLLREAYSVGEQEFDVRREPRRASGDEEQQRVHSAQLKERNQ